MAGTGVGLFSSTGSNNTSNLTVNFAENMAPSNVNNAARELMGHIRDMYEQLGDGYFEFGDGDGAYTVTRGDADTITITGTGDITAVYYVGRKIRITDGGGNVVEGVISASSHSSTTQTIDLTGITLASGTPTKVELGIDTAAFGGKVILDDDGDTYIEAPTDDTIDIYVAGAKDFVITANTFTAESGSTITSPSIKTPLIEFTDGDDAMTIVDGGGVTFPIATTFTSGFIANAASSIGGTTPTLTIGDGGAEDAKILFDGNAHNFHIGLDDSGDKLTIGLGNNLGTTPGFTMDENTNVEFPDNSVTIVASGNGDNLTLKTTDTDDGIGPNLRLYRAVTGAANDSIGTIDWAATDVAGNLADYASIAGQIVDATDGSEDGKLTFKIMNAGSLNQMLTITGPATVVNEGSKDHDFRVESDGNQDMFIVDGGDNRVGIANAPDLGVGLHIKTGDSGASVAADCDELVIEGSANAGISILTGTSNNGRISFGDSGGNQMGQLKYEHSVNSLIFNSNATEALRISTSQVLSTGGEDGPDATNGGITIDTNAEDGAAFTLKNSDVAHGITGGGGYETDTYAVMKKNDASNGGLRLQSASESAISFKHEAWATGENTAESVSATSTWCVDARKKNGTSITGLAADDNLASFRTSDDAQFIIKGDGELFSNQSATVGTYDAYEDAQLVRAFDLNHMQGVINSKFDKFVQYNKDDLQKARLIGTDADGSATPMVNITGMQRLHNGAIWQQYEKTERLANAMYELAKAAVGEEKANEILEQNEIKLLN